VHVTITARGDGLIATRHLTLEVLPSHAQISGPSLPPVPAQRP
jgi:hypothetical protein